MICKPGRGKQQNITGKQHEQDHSPGEKLKGQVIEPGIVSPSKFEHTTGGDKGDQQGNPPVRTGPDIKSEQGGCDEDRDRCEEKSCFHDTGRVEKCVMMWFLTLRSVVPGD